MPTGGAGPNAEAPAPAPIPPPPVGGDPTSAGSLNRLSFTKAMTIKTGAFYLALPPSAPCSLHCALPPSIVDGWYPSYLPCTRALAYLPCYPPLPYTTLLYACAAPRHTCATAGKAFKSEGTSPGLKGRAAMGVVVGEGSKSWLFCYATTQGITFTAEKARDQALDERDAVSPTSPSLRPPP